MAWSLASYAEEVVAAAAEIDTATDPEQAMFALAKYEELVADVESQRLLAKTFLFLVDVAFGEQGQGA